MTQSATWSPGVLTPRCVTFLLSGDGIRYTLGAEYNWSLHHNQQAIAAGQANSCVLTVEGLEPDTDYEFISEHGNFSFQTPKCNGLIDLSEMGLASDNADVDTILRTALSQAKPGETVLVPEGVWETHPLQIPTGVTLHLMQGARIQAVSTRENWEIQPAHHPDGRCFASWEGQPADSYAAIIWAADAEDIVITGLGTIDGGGDRTDWWDWPKETRNGARRPRTIFLSNCDNAQISGVTICNSPSWTVHPIYCDDLVVCGVHIKNPADSPNTDGLNPESCRRVDISGVHISVGDDCIAVKAGKTTPQNTHLSPTTKLRIRQCRFADGHGGVVLGSEMSGSITDVHIHDCEFDGTDRGLRLKTRRDRGGEIANINLERCVMNNVGVALAVNAHYFCDADGKSDHVQSRKKAPVGTGTPRISNISVTELVSDDTRIAFAALLGLPEAPAENIKFDEIKVSFAENAPAQAPLMANNIDDQSGAGVLSENAVIGFGPNIYPKSLTQLKPLRTIC